LIVNFQTRKLKIPRYTGMAPPVLVSGALEDAAAVDRARKLEIWRAQKASTAADKVSHPCPARIPQGLASRERRARLWRFLGSWEEAACWWHLRGDMRRWRAVALSRVRGEGWEWRPEEPTFCRCACGWSHPRLASCSKTCVHER